MNFFNKILILSHNAVQITVYISMLLKAKFKLKSPDEDKFYHINSSNITNKETH